MLLCHAPECKLVAHRKQIYLHFVRQEWAVLRLEVNMRSQKELRVDQLDRGDSGRPSFSSRGHRKTTAPRPGRSYKMGEFSCTQSVRPFRVPPGCLPTIPAHLQNCKERVPPRCTDIPFPNGDVLCPSRTQQRLSMVGWGAQEFLRSQWRGSTRAAPVSEPWALECRYVERPLVI